MSAADVGVIGGSGLYQMEGLEAIEEVSVDTPFGEPSDTLTIGTLDGTRVAFLPRHGRGHRLLPSEVPYRANVYALKSLGVKSIISASAVGSLREDRQPMDMVVPDQLFDRTKARPSTFFGEGVVAHVGFAHPFCPELSRLAFNASKSVVERTHPGGAYVCIEGPQFSTLSESVVYRKLGFDIIGMTALPEAKLAREGEMCYTMLAQVTDYDCWHPDHDTVTSDMVMANVAANVINAKSIIRRLVRAAAQVEGCTCRNALAGAIVTSPEVITPDARKRLDVFLKHHMTQHA